MNRRLIYIAILLFIVGFSIGFYFGVDSCIKKVVQIGSQFIDINYILVQRALYQYDNQIGGRITNAPLCNNTRNQT